MDIAVGSNTAKNLPCLQRAKVAVRGQTYILIMNDANLLTTQLAMHVFFTVG
jgi:hypothetical protein